MLLIRNMIKEAINKVLASLGLKITRISVDEYGVNLEHDINKLLRIIERSNIPVVFDVGANVGQSVVKFKRYCPNAQIHTFEPAEQTYHTLVENTRKYNTVIHNNFGLGAEVKEVRFYENTLDDISSFLEPTSLLWGDTKKTEVLEVNTLDAYCLQQNTKRINLLKIDTQGYDLEVLKGAKDMLRQSSIDIIQMEITIEEIYHHIPRMDEVLKFLFDMEYKLVAFYGYHSKDITARWTDAVFVSPSFKTDLR